MGSVYRAIKMAVALLGFIYMVACGGSTTEVEDSGPSEAGAEANNCGAVILAPDGATVLLPASCTIAPDSSTK